LADKQALRNVIDAVAAKAVSVQRDEAEISLLSAIESFRHGYPYADDTVISRGRIGSDREALATLTTALRECLTALDALQGNLLAMRLFCGRAGPLGRAKAELRRLADFAAEASLEAIRKLDHPVDHLQGVLAFQVLRVMEDTLGVRASMTADRASNGKRGGASYALLLRATLEAAGAQPPEDLLPIMREGKVLAADPWGELYVE